MVLITETGIFIITNMRIKTKESVIYDVVENLHGIVYGEITSIKLNNNGFIINVIEYVEIKGRKQIVRVPGEYFVSKSQVKQLQDLLSQQETLPTYVDDLTEYVSYKGYMLVNNALFGSYSSPIRGVEWELEITSDHSESNEPLPLM